MITANTAIIKKISSMTGIIPGTVAAIALTSPLRYKDYTISKKNGGLRIVSQPAREVKILQRTLREIIEPSLPFHECISAYRKGDSIKKNAMRHLNSRFLLKMDLVEFFPSITEHDLKLHIENYCELELDQDDISAICHISCRAEKRRRPLKLCIGAPSSPWISNSVLYEIDSYIHTLTSSIGVTYSRYADDLTFSCNEPNTLRNIPNEIEKILNVSRYPKLTINENKTIHASKASNRQVTGITITPDNKLSTGRERKRIIRAMHHRMTLGKLNEKQQEELEGHINFIEYIEPGFRARLKKTMRTGV